MMTNPLVPWADDENHIWTNDQIRDAFLLHILRQIYTFTDDSLEAFRKDALDSDLKDLRTRMLNLQMGAALVMLGLVDGVRGPTYWPGIKLVNAKTGEDFLAEDEQWEFAFSHAEGKYLDSIEP
jgi:hypothetical protein